MFVLKSVVQERIDATALRELLAIRSPETDPPAYALEVSV